MKYLTIILLPVALILSSFSGTNNVFNITDFGAQADSTINNNEYIQKAIDKAYEEGGGIVKVPAGTYKTGTILMRSNIELTLDPGAVLKGSALKDDYFWQGEQYQHLIVAKDCENISISGEGMILGTGETDGGVKRGVKTKMPDFRPGLILFEKSNDIKIQNILLKYSDFFAITLLHCEDIIIQGITIKNNYFHPNSDGIDPINCKNLIISDCNITTGDDCICFKDGAENVVVNNCILSTPSSAIKFGTSTTDTFKDIVISNIVIHNSMVGIGVFMKDGGRIENVSFNNISIQDIQDTLSIIPGILRQQIPIFIDIDKRTEESQLGTVKNIRFNNININSYNSVLIQGMKDQPVENIYMNNITFNVSRTFDFSIRQKPKGFADSKFLYHDDHRLTEFAQKESYITIANAEGVVLQNIFVNIPEKTYDLYPRHAVAVYGINGLIHNTIFRNIDAEGIKSSVFHTSSHDADE